MTGALRSSRWFVGDDEVAVLHRVAARNAGIDPAPDGDRPVIGIANSASDLNPCNLPLQALAADVAAGVRAAGGVAMEFPVMSLGEDLMKPSAMLYRNLVAMEVEEYLRSYPLDGVVLLANCDKSVPSAIMGAVERRPARARASPPGRARCRTATAAASAPAPTCGAPGTSHRTGAMSDADWAAFEALPGLRPRRLQHDGHGLEHGDRHRAARPDAARHRGDPRRRPRPRGRRGRDRRADRRDGARRRAPVGRC